MQNIKASSPKDASFIKELLAASGVINDVHRASQSWSVSHFEMFAEDEETKDRPHCQLCHASGLVHSAIIVHETNGMRLRIGHDCLEKLVQLQETGEVKSAKLYTFKTHREKLRRDLEAAFVHAPQKVARNIVAAMTKWLSAQKVLPEHIRETLKWLEKFGTPANNEAAQELLLYYKTHRRFPIADVCTRAIVAAIETHPFRKLIPKTVTLDQLPQLERIASRGYRLNKQRVVFRRRKEILRREREFQDRIEALVHDGTLMRTRLYLSKFTPKNGTPTKGWSVHRKGGFYALAQREVYSPEEKEVLVVPYPLREKKVILLFRASVVYETFAEAHVPTGLVYHDLKGRTHRLL